MIRGKIQGGEWPALDENWIRHYWRDFNLCKTLLVDTEKDSWCPYKVSLYHLWKIVEIGEATVNWRKANAAPVFKKGQQDDPRNKRLISLILVPGKIMERVCVRTWLGYPPDIILVLWWVIKYFRGLFLMNNCNTSKNLFGSHINNW